MLPLPAVSSLTVIIIGPLPSLLRLPRHAGPSFNIFCHATHAATPLPPPLPLPPGRSRCFRTPHTHAAAANTGFTPPPRRRQPRHRRRFATLLAGNINIITPPIIINYYTPATCQHISHTRQ